jgi:hypothetical protein
VLSAEEKRSALVFLVDDADHGFVVRGGPLVEIPHILLSELYFAGFFQ